MPRRTPESMPSPPHVSALVKQWGQVIRAQRIRRKIRMRDFAHRINVSLNTLQRIERGESSVQTVNYLTALELVGMLDTLCPTPPIELALSLRSRVEKEVEQDDYF